jgi:hypothetical protein
LIKLLHDLANEPIPGLLNDVALECLFQILGEFPFKQAAVT